MRVLVVDDHPDVRRLLEIDLGLAGLEVETVGSIAEARLRLRRGGVDRVVTDRWLEDGDGEALAVDAGVAALVVSGSYVEVTPLGDRVLRVPKPFRTAELVALLHELP